MDLNELIAADIAETEARGCTERHIVSLRSRARVMARTMPSLDPAAVDYDFLIEYQRRRRETGTAGQTISREYETLRRALKIAKRRGIDTGLALKEEWPKCRRSPADKRKSGKLRDPELLRRYLEELGPGEARDEVMVAMMTGLRSAELKRLRFEWFRPVDGREYAAWLTMPDASTKNRRERGVGIYAPCWEIIQRRGDECCEVLMGPVFSDVDHKAARYAASRRAGSETTITLRDCRHTFATEALRSSADAAGVMAALGHSDLAMTQRYQSSTQDRTAAVGAGPAAMVEEATKG